MLLNFNSGSIGLEGSSDADIGSIRKRRWESEIHHQQQQAQHQMAGYSQASHGGRMPGTVWMVTNPNTQGMPGGGRSGSGGESIWTFPQLGGSTSPTMFRGSSPFPLQRASFHELPHSHGPAAQPAARVGLQHRRRRGEVTWVSSQLSTRIGRRPPPPKPRRHSPSKHSGGASGTDTLNTSDS
ncbi:hypothetical protein C4D60_Mb06t03990 [Musa balbisiana]|uniref:Uncharacterized protein n=1 Tax=Musa balbisiana TaxID=52838 RepID=A0A4S8IKG6_MUSBA|nr:hypothetical protein C4D60_Mb06t03990 [Musa balbisiana]